MMTWNRLDWLSMMRSRIVRAVSYLAVWGLFPAAWALRLGAEDE